MTEAQWYAKIDGVETGPISPSQMKEMVEEGQIDAGTMVKRDGMKAFVPAKQVRGLLPAANQAPAASPNRDRAATRRPTRPAPSKRLIPVIIGGVAILLAVGLWLGLSGGGNSKRTSGEESKSQKTDSSSNNASVPSSPGNRSTGINEAEVKALEVEGGKIEDDIPSITTNLIVNISLNQSDIFAVKAVISDSPELWAHKDRLLAFHAKCTASEALTRHNKLEAAENAKKRAEEDKERQAASAKRDAEHKEEQDKADKEKKEAEAKRKAERAAAETERAKDDSLRKVTEARELLLSEREKYLKDIAKYEERVMEEAALLSVYVVDWLKPTKDKIVQNNHWKTVQDLFKDQNGWKMDDRKRNSFSTRYLQDAIKEAASADVLSVSSGNKTVLKEGDLANPGAVPEFEFILPVTGDKNPVILKKNGAPIRLNEIKAK